MYKRQEYDINGVDAGIPSIIGRDGVREIVTLDITAEEEKKLKGSCELLKNASEGIDVYKRQKSDRPRQICAIIQPMPDNLFYR